MTVNVHLFGHYSDLFHGEQVELQMPPGSRVRDVAETLAGRDPRLANIASHCRFAVNEEYASQDTELSDGCAIAVLPPMSGG